MGNVFGESVNLSVPSVNLSLGIKGVDGYFPPSPPLYFKTPFFVFCGTRKVFEADVSSFQELRDGYGKDTFRVFYNGIVVPEADAGSFKALQNGYAQDSFRAFFRGKLVNGA